VSQLKIAANEEDLMRRKFFVASAIVLFLGFAAQTAQRPNLIFVTNAGDHFVTVIKEVADDNYQSYGEIWIGGGTFTPIISPDGNWLYVAAANYDTKRGWVAAVNLNQEPFKVSHTYELTGLYGGSAFGLAITPDGTKLYVTDRSNGEIVAIWVDGSQPNKQIVPESGGSRGEPALRYLVISSEGKRAYAAGQLRGIVYVVDLKSDTVVGSIPGIASARGLALSRDSKLLYVSQESVGQITVINTETLRVVQTIGIPLGPNELGGLPSLAISPNGKLLFVPVFYGFVRVIDTDPGSATYHQVIARIPAGSFYRYGAYVTADNEYLYITNQTERLEDRRSLVIYEFGQNAGVIWFEKIAALPTGRGPWLAVGTH
jgi:DNA-binding beta-propeller fold protein YncE